MTNVYSRKAPVALFAAIFGLFALSACASSDPTGLEPIAPAITVEGVQEGATYTGSVSIVIRLDRGSYDATLNGTPITSGHTVMLPGSYTLTVNARNGLATSTKQVRFSIAGPQGGLVIIRLINLGTNGSAPGDAILVTDSSAAGRVHAMIDAGGGPPDGNDTGHVLRRLDALGVDTLQFMLLTHAHFDHYAGMATILNAKKVRRFFYNGQVRTSTTYTAAISAAQSRADTITIVRDTIPVPFGRSAAPGSFTVIPPLPTYINTNTNDGDLLNEGSLGTSFRRGTFEMFFTGDGEYEANVRWRTQFPTYSRNIDVLKIGHHGANNAIFDSGISGASTWLDHTAPTYAVMSTNGTTHPRVNALTRILERTNRRTFCTSVHGEITIRVAADGTYTVTPEKAAGMDCVPGSQANT